jgi:hypothetical protein
VSLQTLHDPGDPGGGTSAREERLEEESSSDESNIWSSRHVLIGVASALVGAGVGLFTILAVYIVQFVVF